MSRTPEEESDGRRDEEFDALGAAEELEASLEAGAASASGEADAYVAMLEGEIAALQGDLTEVRARAERAEALAEQVAGEVERSKERLAREAEREGERRHRGTLKRFLEVLDDLDRAIESARAMDHNPDVLTGVELVRKRFLSVLGDLGVTRIESLGASFDPAVHDAVSAVPVSEPAQDGAVVGVVSEGYAIGDELLRPARVAVGKAS